MVMRRIIGAIACLAISTSCGGPEGGELQPVTFMAGFTAQANLPFVGVYVAKELGYFEERGLDVTIQHSTGAGEHLQLLAAGTIDVTTQDAAVLLQRRNDPGIPLVSIGLIGQTGQQAFVALVDSGITDPSEWAGRSVGFKGTPPPDVFAILDAVGLSEEDVDLINVGFDPRVLTEGQIDVYPVFKSNEPDLLARQGFDLVMWDAADYGIPTLGLTYVVTEQSVESEPEMLAAFMVAALQGISYAAANPDAAIDIVMGYVGDQGDEDHQRFILDVELRDSVSEVTETNGVGWQTREQWSSLAAFLEEYDALEPGTMIEDVFTNDFLPGA
jgi:ABC-type nitrate/sulfonate/bicarbonate transport system substrate-binding protein